MTRVAYLLVGVAFGVFGSALMWRTTIAPIVVEQTLAACPAPQPPPPSVSQCMPIWFGAKPHEFTKARERMCPRRAKP